MARAPAGHVVGEVLPAEQKDPAGHVVGVEAPNGQYLPAGHALQDLTAPLALLKVPDGHGAPNLEELALGQ